MTKFTDTAAAEEFIASASSRKTSPEVMKAIAFFARNEDEAIALWEGDGIDVVARLLDVWENATQNGRISDEILFWDGRTLDEIMAENE